MADKMQEKFQALTEENQRLRAESEALKREGAGLQKVLKELFQQFKAAKEGREEQARQ